MKTKWTSRKLTMLLAMTVLFTLLLVYDKINQDSYVSLMTILLLAYFSGNVGEHFAQRGN